MILSFFVQVFDQEHNYVEKHICGNDQKFHIAKAILEEDADKWLQSGNGTLLAVSLYLILRLFSHQRI